MSKETIWREDHLAIDVTGNFGATVGDGCLRSSSVLVGLQIGSQVFDLDVLGSQIAPADPDTTKPSVQALVVIGEDQTGIVFGIGFQVLVPDDDDGLVIQRLFPIPELLRQRGLG